MSDPFVSEIRIFGFNFAPLGWAFCNGQLLPISQNTALFSLLGTTYGGNGTSNFALPNLRGSVGVGQGVGPGLNSRALGEVGGAASSTLITSEMAGHSHVPACDTVGDNSNESPVGNVWGADLDGGFRSYSSGAPNVNMAANLIGNAGGGQAHSNQMPTLALNFCIALQGVYPPRS